jgi:hypothetical protein
MFGDIPVYGFFIRHAKGVSLNNVEISYLSDEFRPPFSLENVNGVDFYRVSAQHASDIPIFVLKNVSDFITHECKGVPNLHLDRVDQKKL